VSVLIACHDREIIDLPGVRRFHLEGGKLVPAP
jgi:ABC-type ATPase involved in cell division